MPTIPPLPLLMTASVSTRGMRGALFTDRERLAMYEQALRFYLADLMPASPGLKIVFVENSGYDLSPMIERLSQSYPQEIKRVEFLTLDPSFFDISRGKGHNEAHEISMALDLSPTIKQAGAFFKVTGRYPIFNIKHFVDEATRKIGEGDELYADIKDHNLYRLLGLKWSAQSMDTRLMAMTTRFWREVIAPDIETINDDDNYFETYCFYRCRPVPPRRATLRFSREPNIGGIAGHHAAGSFMSSGHSGLKARFKRMIANGLRIIAPRFWF